MLKAFSELHTIWQGFDWSDKVLEQTIGTSTCISGCGKCCMINVPYMRTIETINAVSVLMGTGKLKLAVAIAEGWLLEHHKVASTYEGVPIPMASPKVHEEWLALRRSQCPFLDDRKECLIHQCRPLGCRAYGVTYSPINECPRAPGRDETLTQHKYADSTQLRNRVNDFWADCKRKPEWLISGFTPTLIYRAAEPEKFKKLVLDNRIASAKIVGVDYEISLMWQPQLDALNRGISPDIVSVMK